MIYLLVTKAAGNNPNNFPTVPKSIGGDIDFMIGIKYLRYYPEKIFQLPSGLAIYKSVFENSPGGRGIIGGPHKVFTEIQSSYQNSQQFHSFLSTQYEQYKNGYQINPDVAMLGVKCDDYYNDLLSTLADQSTVITEFNRTSLVNRNHSIFKDVENAASEINYRCINCRNCRDCKHNEMIESVSVKEEMEQELINKSVSVDLVNRVCIASLPLLYDPVLKLSHNKSKGLQVYNLQLRKLNKSPEDKAEVFESEKKLQDLGHVEYLKNLTDNQQK